MAWNTNVDQFFVDGCGRCPLGGTPDCKVHLWPTELEVLRGLLLESDLHEESKWGFPCYTLQGKNVLMLGVFNDYCSISFFKGALIENDFGLLVKPGPNSQAARLIKFTSMDQIVQQESEIKDLIQQAIDIEKAGRIVEFKKNPEPIPEELLGQFNEDPAFESAFLALTPGRQRGYILHIGQAKQAKTRLARIEKYKPMIMSGIGLHDKYQRKKR
jgi:uncharacterized protein YdeI (YjbR/CyaY-like superfamily)